MDISVLSNIFEYVCDVDVGDVVGGDEVKHALHADEAARVVVGVDLHRVTSVPRLDLVTADGQLEDAVGPGIDDG